MPNMLAQEMSPYLLQHAHNPVDWYPWGEEAFRVAKEQGKPLLISIGYAACHWCHVMERESFEDLDTAAYMNEHFINVKVDREEYPEVDDFYITAVQAISGTGGWPLNVFVTHDKLPFYGGTYFPPKPAYGRPSWMQIIERMHHVWVHKMDEVMQQSGQLLAYLQNAAKASQKEVTAWDKSDIQKAYQSLLQQADALNGGFGAAPKFPATMALSFLIEYAHFFGDQQVQSHGLFSLEKMLDGGIYDRLGGGLSRYTVDAAWAIPHFEKMLYDNALFIHTLCDAFSVSPKRIFKEAIIASVTFVLRELKAPDAGFYSAIDADSEGEEGKFYTWTFEALQSVLPDAPEWLWAYFGVTEHGNWEHTNILQRTVDEEAIAAHYKLPIDEVLQTIEAAKQRLFSARSQRIRPITDDKMLLSWNALMNQALVRAATVLEQSEWLEIAEAHAVWMFSAFDVKNAPKHTFKNGVVRIDANLDDLAFLIQALTMLSAATNKEVYVVDYAVGITEYILRYYTDAAQDLLFFTSTFSDEIPLRKPDCYDGIVPSSNAVMAHNFHLIGILLQNQEWIDRGERMVDKMKDIAIHTPYGHAYWLILAQRMFVKYKTIVATGDAFDEKEAELRKKFAPHCYIFFEKAENFVTMPIRKLFIKDSQIFICTKNECFPTLEMIPETIDFAIL